MLCELVPGIDKEAAKDAARRLASLRAFQSINRSTSHQILKWQLMKLANQLLEKSEQRHQTSNGGTEDVSPKAEEPSVDLHRAKVDRHHILMNTVGETMYNDILEVTEEIRQIKRTSALWTRFGKQDLSEVDDDQDVLPASKALPSPIVDLYYRVQMMDVMTVVDSKTVYSLEELPERCNGCVIKTSDWNLLLKDAKEKLAAYRKFEKENVREGEDLSFSCKSGMCFMRR